MGGGWVVDNYTDSLSWLGWAEVGNKIRSISDELTFPEWVGDWWDWCWWVGDWWD